MADRSVAARRIYFHADSWSGRVRVRSLYGDSQPAAKRRPRWKRFAMTDTPLARTVARVEATTLAIGAAGAMYEWIRWAGVRRWRWPWAR